MQKQHQYFDRSSLELEIIRDLNKVDSANLRPLHNIIKTLIKPKFNYQQIHHELSSFASKITKLTEER